MFDATCGMRSVCRVDAQESTRMRTWMNEGASDHRVQAFDLRPATDPVDDRRTSSPSWSCPGGTCGCLAGEIRSAIRGRAGFPNLWRTRRVRSLRQVEQPG